MNLLRKLVKPVRRFDLDEARGVSETQSKTYDQVLLASIERDNEAIRQKGFRARSFASWQRKLVKPVWAHCDLMCGVYDPEQARIEAKSVYAIATKYQEADDDVFKQRCVILKEQRAQLAKEHLWVLWTDYFKAEHVEKWPELHDLFWRATKQAGEAKKSMDPAEGKKLLSLIDEIDDIFKQTR